MEQMEGNERMKEADFMKIDQDIIDKVMVEYNKLTDEDVHIKNSDSDKIRRHKDMMFGKILGYQEILIQLGIID